MRRAGRGAEEAELAEPAVFWFWNATPTRDEIDARVDAYFSKGIGAIYIHPMPQSFRPAEFHGGMTVEYLSPAFFDLIRHACVAVRTRGMTLWLYDEGGWPSGMAGGKVVAENPAYGIRVLDRDRDGRITPTQLLDQVPYPDLMNPDATDCFIRHTHEQYRACVGEHFGKTVPGIFTDEPRIHGRVGTSRIPWSPMLVERCAAFGAFRDALQSGQILREHAQDDKRREAYDSISRLFDGAPDDEQTIRVRREYLAAISTLVANNYYRRIREWCEKHNLLFEGHHSGEDEFGRHGQYFGDYLQQAAQYHIPGIDTIWRQTFPGKPGGNFVALASSAAWLAGKRVALSESFSVYGMGLTLEQMKWLSAFQIVRGVNKIGSMASLHSTAGTRRISLVTDISPNNTIWRDIDLYVDFTRNAAQFSCAGQPQVRVGVYYRMELTAEGREQAFRAAHEAICDRIGDDLAGWMFVGYEDLENAQPHPQGVRLACGIALSALVVHIDAPLSELERALLDRLRKHGVIVATPGHPERSEGSGLDDGSQVLREYAGEDMLGAPVDFRSYSSFETDQRYRGVRALHLQEGATTRLMFFNQNPDEVRLRFRMRDASIRALREVELDPTRIKWRNPIERNDDWFALALQSGECRAFESADEMMAQPTYALKSEVVISGPWTIVEQERYRIADRAEVVSSNDKKISATELGDFAKIDPAFSGSLVYRTSFDASPKDSKAVLDLGTVYYSAEVRVNGRPVGRRAWPGFEFDVTDVLKEVGNIVEIRVTNTPANVWMSPEVHERDRAELNNMYLEKASAFMAESVHAGLVGPARLRFFAAEQLNKTSTAEP